MTTKVQKSMQDFKGLAMPLTQQIKIKGGQDNLTKDSDIIIVDDLLDT